MAEATGRREVDWMMARLQWFFVAGLLAALPASAEIFKCAEKNGIDRYQNFPCSIDSIGSLPSGPPSAQSTSVPGGAGPARPAPMPVAVASAGRLANTSEPRVGMTEAEVTAMWGAPEETIQDEPKEGRIEIWRYADGRSVQFSNKRRVLAVRR